MILVILLAIVFYGALYSGLNALFSKASGGDSKLAKVLSIAAIVLFVIIYGISQGDF